ncbi:hypothetical protein [Candidatus Amarolinea dominans]
MPYAAPTGAKDILPGRMALLAPHRTKHPAHHRFYGFEPLGADL